MDNSIYLDIETSWQGNITIIGFYHPEYGLTQLIRPNITPESLLNCLPQADFLFTYHGHSFDIPVIAKELDIHLRQIYRSIDLRVISNRYNLYGGLKKVEQILGISRELPDINGIEAMNLWAKYRDLSDNQALEDLLIYNRQDVINLIELRAKLEVLGFNC